MRFVGSTSGEIWRQRVIGGLSTFGLYIALHFFGVVRLDLFALSALLVGFTMYAVALLRPSLTLLRWPVACWDVFAMFLLIRATGMTASPFTILLPVWFFGVALANLIDGDTRPVPWMLALGLAGLLAGGWGGPNFALYAVTSVAASAAMGAAVFTLTSERTAGRSDPLLPMLLNRSAGLERLEALARGRETFTLAFVDLGEFKQINDRHGHKVGDEVLLETGRRLKAGVSKGDLVARYGGDEFLVAVRDPQSLERVRALLEAPVNTSSGEVIVRADIGSVPFERGEDVDALLERADVAMYRHKRAAKLTLA
jgi:diguanylate cyclase (GGDEF)-like protein